MSLRFSIIIPATNEEDFIVAAIQSVPRYPDTEIIVVVNGSHDATAARARETGARVVEFPHPLLAGGARNEGAHVASGETFVFLDADSLMQPHTLEEINKAGDVFGTVLGAPIEKKFGYRLFFLIKNTAHRLSMYHGVLGGLFFCPAELFRRVEGYDVSLKVNEIADIVGRMRAAGGKYRVLTSVTAHTSMRRFEKHGLISPLIFWCWIKLVWLWRDKRAKLGEAYATTHDRLFS